MIRIILIILALIAPIRAGWIYAGEAMVIDSCLNKGGSYDYQNMRCDFEQNHQFIPFSKRHPNHFRNSGIWFGAFSLVLIGTFIIKKKAEPVAPLYGDNARF